MAVNPDKNIVEQSLIARLIGKIKRIALDMDDSVTAETSRAQAAEAAAKTEVVQGENCTIEKTTAADGHDVYTVNADGKPQVQADWSQADSSAVDFIKNKPNLALKENVANKSQSIDPTSTTEYGSSKAVADFVNSSVATNTANFLGTIAESSLGLDYTATNEQIALALNVHSWESSPTNNDYCFVSVNDPQTTDVDEYRRFKFNGSVWAYEYTLNNSSFTQAQWDAINSGLTSSDRTAYNAAVTLLNAHVNDGSIHVTTAEKNAWNSKYTKPSTGIPKTDLASAVQTSIGKADSALQSHQSVTDNNPTLAWGATSTVGTVGSTNLRVTMPSNPASGKADNTPTFTEASTRANLNGSGETMPTILGKIKKWFTDLGSLAFKDTLSSFNYESIGSTAVDLNDKLYANECHAYAWTYANRNNVANRPTNDGGVVLSFAFYTTTYGVQIAMDGNDYEKPLYIRFKAANKWKDWIPFRDASWINSGTFDAARIPTSLPNVTAGAASAAVSGSALETSIKGKVTIESDVFINGVSSTQVYEVGGCDNNTNGDLARPGYIFLIKFRDGGNRSGQAQLWIQRGDYNSSDFAYKLVLIGSRGGAASDSITFAALPTQNSDNAFKLYIKTKSWTFVSISLLSRGYNSKPFVFNSEPQSIGTDFPTGCVELNWIRQVHVSTQTTAVGSPTTPVYVNSNGQVQPCDPSQMGVGAASYASATAAAASGSTLETQVNKGLKAYKESIKWVKSIQGQVSPSTGSSPQTITLEIGDSNAATNEQAGIRTTIGLTDGAITLTMSFGADVWSPWTDWLARSGVALSSFTSVHGVGTTTPDTVVTTEDAMFDYPLSGTQTYATIPVGGGPSQYTSIHALIHGMVKFTGGVSSGKVGILTLDLVYETGNTTASVWGTAKWMIVQDHS